MIQNIRYGYWKLSCSMSGGGGAAPEELSHIISDSWISSLSAFSRQYELVSLAGWTGMEWTDELRSVLHLQIWFSHRSLLVLS